MFSMLCMDLCTVVIFSIFKSICLFFPKVNYRNYSVTLLQRSHTELCDTPITGGTGINTKIQPLTKCCHPHCIAMTVPLIDTSKHLGFCVRYENE